MPRRRPFYHEPNWQMLCCRTFARRLAPLRKPVCNQSSWAWQEVIAFRDTLRSPASESTGSADEFIARLSRRHLSIVISLMNFWLIDVPLTLPPLFVIYDIFDRYDHRTTLHFQFSWIKLAAWNRKFSGNSSSAAIRWTTRSWGNEKAAEIPIEFKGEEPSEKKEEEKHASVIDVISHNRRHRHKNPLASLAYSMCRYVFSAEKSFTFFLHFTFFSLSSSFVRSLSAYGYGLMRRRHRRGKGNYKTRKKWFGARLRSQFEWFL